MYLLGSHAAFLLLSPAVLKHRKKHFCRPWHCDNMRKPFSYLQIVRNVVTTQEGMWRVAKGKIFQTNPLPCYQSYPPPLILNTAVMWYIILILGVFNICGVGCVLMTTVQAPFLQLEQQLTCPLDKTKNETAIWKESQPRCLGACLPSRTSPPHVL